MFLNNKDMVSQMVLLIIFFIVVLLIVIIILYNKNRKKPNSNYSTPPSANQDCSQPCGTGLNYPITKCVALNPDGSYYADAPSSSCINNIGNAPTQSNCNTQQCSWYTSDWGSCSQPCDTGSQNRIVYCPGTQNSCPGAPPPSNQPCNTFPCPSEQNLENMNNTSVILYDPDNNLSLYFGVGVAGYLSQTPTTFTGLFNSGVLMFTIGNQYLGIQNSAFIMELINPDYRNAFGIMYNATLNNYVPVIVGTFSSPPVIYPLQLIVTGTAINAVVSTIGEVVSLLQPR